MTWNFWWQYFGCFYVVIRPFFFKIFLAILAPFIKDFDICKRRLEKSEFGELKIRDKELKSWVKEFKNRVKELLLVQSI